MLRHILLLTLAIFAITSSAASLKEVQENKVTLKERKILGEVPYQIKNIELNGRAVKMNSSFLVGNTGDEWEKKMTFNFVNTSSKNMTHVFIKLLVLNPDKSKPSALAPFFSFMSSTASSVLHQFRNVKTQELFRDVPELKPGETLQIRLQSKDYNAFQKMIGKIGFSNSGSIKDVIIWIDKIGFSDGTIWRYGSYLKPDPKDSDKWIPTETLAFKGADGRSKDLSSHKKTMEIQAKSFIKNFGGNLPSSSSSSSSSSLECGNLRSGVIYCGTNDCNITVDYVYPVEGGAYGSIEFYAWDSCYDPIFGWCNEYLIEIIGSCGGLVSTP